MDSDYRLIKNNLSFIDTPVTGYEYIEITVSGTAAINTANKVFISTFNFIDYMNELSSFNVGDIRYYDDYPSMNQLKNNIIKTNTELINYNNAKQQYSATKYIYTDSSGTKIFDIDKIIDAGYYLTDSSADIQNINFAEEFNNNLLKGITVEYFMTNNKNLMWIKQEVVLLSSTTSVPLRKIYRTSNKVLCTNGEINDRENITWLPWQYIYTLNNSSDAITNNNDSFDYIDMTQYQITENGITYHDIDSMIAVNGYAILSLGSNFAFFDGVLPADIDYVPSYIISIAFKPSGTVNVKWTKQTIGCIIRSKPEYFRVYNSTLSQWSDWRMVGDGGTSGTTYENTFNITKEFYDNTYNITTTPSITTDTNNFLASTNDQSDRAAEIKSMLNSTGYCKLGPGDFYITGVELANYNSIEGSGPATKVHLLNTSESKNYCFKLADYCSISNMSLYGKNISYIIQETIQDEHGILFAANADEEESGPTAHWYNTIQNCQFWYFAGGGITCHNTGFGTAASLYVTNCLMEKCCVGINIDYWSEYHKFTNVCAHGCWYGCINNGGNNIIASCNFSSNKVGILMDNSTGTMKNNSHGTISNCAINHSNSNTGDGIRAIRMTSGEIITGCQFFYSNIVLINCFGFQFSNNLFGGSTVNPITLDGGGYNTFINNAFNKAPSAINIENNAKYKFINNINALDGLEITP